MGDTFKNVNIDVTGFTCAICFDVMTTPVSISCGHTFCYMCIKRSMQRTKKCPTCQKAVCDHIPQKNIIIDDVIMKLFPERLELENKTSKIIDAIRTLQYRKYIRNRCNYIITGIKDYITMFDVSDLDIITLNIIMSLSEGSVMRKYRLISLGDINKNDKVYIYKFRNEKTRAELVRKNKNIFTDAESVVKIYNESIKSFIFYQVNLRELIKHQIADHNFDTKYQEILEKMKTLELTEKPISMRNITDLTDGDSSNEKSENSDSDSDSSELSSDHDEEDTEETDEESE
jgi:hypothetical protein